MSVILEAVDTDLRAEDGKFYEVATQNFTQNYWDGLQWAKEQDRMQRCPDLWRVASIPAIFVHKWYKEGFDIDRAPLKEVIARLHRDNLTEFLTTSKRVA